MSFHDITQRVIDRGGFWYAAHITSDNGVLKGKHNNLWKSDKLVAAQIPSKNEVNPNYINILKTKTLIIKRKLPLLLLMLKTLVNLKI